MDAAAQTFPKGTLKDGLHSGLDRRRAPWDGDFGISPLAPVGRGCACCGRALGPI